MTRPALVLLIVLGFICSFSGSALAGIEPSPFKDQVDAITIHVKDLRKQVEKRIATPMYDTMQADVRKAVAEFHGVAGAIMDLNIISKKIAADFILCPGCEVMGVEPSPFKDLKRQVKKLISSIDEFLSLAISGEIYAVPKIIGASENLRDQAVVLKKTVKDIVDIIGNANFCSVDADCGCNGDAAECRGFQTQDVCDGQLGCSWTVVDEMEHCWPTDGIFTECSDIPFDQCENRYPCYTMSCVDGLCQY